MSTLKANSYQHVDRASPSITINSDGSVSISSTVTYEDVTSVDAVGMVTARSGLRATAGGLNVTAGISTFGDDVSFTGAAANTTWDKSANALVFNDHASIQVGTGTDLIIKHDGTHSYIQEGGTGQLKLDSSTLEIRNYANSNTMAKFVGDLQVELYYNNTKRLTTTNTGVDITDNLSVAGILTVSDYIQHLGDTNTAIRFPAADTISFETSGGEQLRISSGGQLLSGLTTPYATVLSSQTPKIQLESTTVGGSSMFLLRDGTDAGGPFLFLGHGRGGATIVQDDDELGNITFVGADGTNFQNAAAIKGLVDGTPGSGTDMPGRLSFWTSPDGSTTMAERLRITSAGELLLGATASAMVGGGAASLYQIETTSQNALSCVAHRGTGNASGSILILGKSRGTSAGSVTVVADDDQLGAIRFAGADGTDLQSRGGEISCSVDGSPGNDDMPGRLMFSTTADDASTPTERMRITSAGDVCINRTSAISDAKLSIDCDATQPAIAIQCNHTNTDTDLITAWNSGGKNIVNITAETDNSPYLKFEIWNPTASAVTERFRVSHLGNVAIGGGTAASNRLEVIADHKGFPSDSAQPNASLLIKHGTSGSNRRWIGIGASLTGAWIQSSSPGGTGLAAPISINPGGGDVGINLRDPDVLLDIHANADAEHIKLEGTDGATAWTVGSTNTHEGYMRVYNDGTIAGMFAANMVSYIGNSLLGQFALGASNNEGGVSNG